jgi:hypothetical protein
MLCIMANCEGVNKGGTEPGQAGAGTGAGAGSGGESSADE